MKTISIILDDEVYEELGVMLDAMGQTKQTFYETYTITALRERSIPFVIKAPLPGTHTNKNSRMAAFNRLEESRKAATESEMIRQEIYELNFSGGGPEKLLRSLLITMLKERKQ